VNSPDKNHIPQAISDDESEALLFAALREVLGSGSGPAQDGINTRIAQEALALAARQFLDLMVARGLQCLGAAEDATGLDERSKRELRRALMLERDRLSISKALASKGIEHLFFKGALSDSLWWDGQGMRGAGDLDILIPPSAEAESTAALKNLGYKQKRTMSNLASEKASKERLFYHEDLKTHFPVDLHIGLLNEPPYRDPAAQVLRRAMVYETATGSIRGPCREDMLLIAAGNLGQSCFAERYKLVVDAACLLLREPLDFREVVSRAKECNVTTPLWGLLRLVEERLHVPVPGWLLRELAPFRPLRGMVELVAGVTKAPWHPNSTGKLVLASWPLSGRAFWPVLATWRWAQFRIASILHQNSESPKI
jgi:hypothetical protein